MKSTDEFAPVISLPVQLMPTLLPERHEQIAVLVDAVKDELKRARGEESDAA